MSGNYKVRVINGPNLNLLGRREPEIYGRSTLADIEKKCSEVAKECGLDIEFLQSNHEGDLIDGIQSAIGEVEAIIINAAAYTHTSIAIHDALRMYDGLAVELHISNPHAREKFRHISYVSSAVNAVIAGLGVRGYELAVRSVANTLSAKS